MFGFFFGLLLYGLLAQLARAPALQAGGQGFDSLTVHEETVLIVFIGATLRRKPSHVGIA